MHNCPLTTMKPLVKFGMVLAGYAAVPAADAAAAARMAHTSGPDAQVSAGMGHIVPTAKVQFIFTNSCFDAFEVTATFFCTISTR